MFNSKEVKSKVKGPEVISGELNIIGVGTSITGDIKSNGDLRIDGSITGTVTSKARIVQGPNGNIEGDVLAQNGDIQGTVSGTIDITEILYLKSTAIVNGDISSGKLVVEAGAQFNGRCDMKNSNKPLSDNIKGDITQKGK